MSPQTNQKADQAVRDTEDGQRDDEGEKGTGGAKTKADGGSRRHQREGKKSQEEEEEEEAAQNLGGR